MENEVRTYIRKENADFRVSDKTSIRLSVCYTDEGESNGMEEMFADEKDFEDEIIFKLVIRDIMRSMTNVEKEVTRKCLDGYTIREISREANCHSQNIYQVRKRLQKKLLGLYKDQLKYY